MINNIRAYQATHFTAKPTKETLEQKKKLADRAEGLTENGVHVQGYGDKWTISEEGKQLEVNYGIKFDNLFSKRNPDRLPIINRGGSGGGTPITEEDRTGVEELWRQLWDY